jgi:hypothetical protein
VLGTGDWGGRGAHFGVCGSPWAWWQDVLANGNHSTGGVVGMLWTFPALDENNYSDVALRTLLQDDYPSTWAPGAPAPAPASPLLFPSDNGP